MAKRIITPAVAETSVDEVVMVARYYNDYVEIVTAQCELDNDIADRSSIIKDSEKTIMIGGDALIELNSANPSWNIAKSSNYHNEDDIIEVIDRIEAGTLPKFRPSNSGLI